MNKQLEFPWMSKKPRLGKFIAKGSSRMAFHSGRNTVLKLAYTALGIEQNKAEVKASRNGGPIARIIAHDANFTWVLQERAYYRKYLNWETFCDLRHQLSDVCTDLCRSNIGYIKGRMVAIDYGYNSEVEKLYNTPVSSLRKPFCTQGQLVNNYNGIE